MIIGQFCSYAISFFLTLFIYFLNKYVNIKYQIFASIYVHSIKIE